MNQRVQWVDAAKGLTIILVVMGHAYGYAVVLGADSDFWRTFNGVFSMMRMPLFFLLSGVFAVSWVNRPWAELLRGKVLLLMWVYLLWVVIRFVFFSFVPSLTYPNESGSLFRLFAQAVWSSMPTWFLYALAAFFVAARVIRKTPVWPQLGAAGVVSAIFMADIVTLPSSLWTGLAEYFVFFLLGMHATVSIRSWGSSNIGRTVSLSLIPVWAVLTWSSLAYGWIGIPGARFALSLLAIPAGIGLGIALSRSRLARHFGQNTMSIYLAHALILGGIAAMLSGLPPEILAGSGWWLPIVLVFISTGVSLLLHWLLNLTSIRGIYDTPSWLDRLATRFTLKT